MTTVPLGTFILIETIFFNTNRSVTTTVPFGTFIVHLLASPKQVEKRKSVWIMPLCMKFLKIKVKICYEAHMNWENGFGPKASVHQFEGSGYGDAIVGNGKHPSINTYDEK